MRLVHSASIQDRDGAGWVFDKIRRRLLLDRLATSFSADRRLPESDLPLASAGSAMESATVAVGRGHDGQLTLRYASQPTTNSVLARAEPSSSTAQKPSFGTLASALPQSMLGIANGPMRAYTSFGTP